MSQPYECRGLCAAADAQTLATRGAVTVAGLAACALPGVDSPEADPACDHPCTPTSPLPQSPPTFDVCIEMRSRHEWRVHADVAWAVDRLLMGKEAGEFFGRLLCALAELHYGVELRSTSC